MCLPDLGKYLINEDVLKAVCHHFEWLIIHIAKDIQHAMSFSACWSVGHLTMLFYNLSKY